MQLAGVIVAGLTLLLIGFGHIWVRKVKYHFGPQAWPPVALLGVAIIFYSLLLPDAVISAVAGIMGSTILWGAWELVGKPANDRGQENLREEKRSRGYFPRQ